MREKRQIKWLEKKRYTTSNDYKIVYHALKTVYFLVECGGLFALRILFTSIEDVVDKTHFFRPIGSFLRVGVILSCFRRKPSILRCDAIKSAENGATHSVPIDAKRSLTLGLSDTAFTRRIKVAVSNFNCVAGPDEMWDVAR